MQRTPETRDSFAYRLPWQQRKRSGPDGRLLAEQLPQGSLPVICVDNWLSYHNTRLIWYYNMVFLLLASLLFRAVDGQVFSRGFCKVSHILTTRFLFFLFKHKNKQVPMQYWLIFGLLADHTKDTEFLKDL